VEDTWSSRDLPVLEAVVSMLDEPGHYFVAVHEIAERTGLDKMEVARALDALDGPYIADYQRLMSGGNPTNWHIGSVNEAARRAVGQWPTPESLVDRLVQGLNQAAEHDTDPARKRRLREAATVLGETARGVVTEVVAKVIVHVSHMG
jgi:hypothetical protein